MGDGYAIEPTSSDIVSPVAGEVSLVQGHAIGFTRADGLEVLLHLGIDTVSLNGQPFQIKVKVGDIVDGGDALGQVNWKEVEAAGLPLTSMVLITNTNEKLDSLTVKKELLKQVICWVKQLQNKKEKSWQITKISNRNYCCCWW